MPDAIDTINDAIAEQAIEPASVTADGVTVNQRPIADMIEARDAVSGVGAGAQPHRGLRFTKLIPAGE